MASLYYRIFFGVGVRPCWVISLLLSGDQRQISDISQGQILSLERLDKLDLLMQQSCYEIQNQIKMLTNLKIHTQQQPFYSQHINLGIIIIRILERQCQCIGQGPAMSLKESGNLEALTWYLEAFSSNINIAV